MRFIKNLSYDTTRLLQRIYQKSNYHQVRQRAQCILLSYQGYMTNELAHLFKVNRITIYNWFNEWESRHFAGLYDRKGKGRPPLFNQDQKEQIRQWVKLYPKNLNQVIALIQKEFDLSASKSTIKRVLKSLNFSWHRIRRRVKGKPDPGIYQQRKEALEVLLEEDKRGIIDLYYFDESGFCLVPYVPYAWQEQDDPISVESTPSKRLNVLGFMNKHNDLDAYCFEGAITSEVVIHCIHSFCNHIQGPTVVILDNASIHTSEAFQANMPGWERKGLEIFYLPEYSPELNLIEILWRFMKYEWIEFSAYASWGSLVNCVENMIKNFGVKHKINFG